jgi:hypothetical protein
VSRALLYLFLVSRKNGFLKLLRDLRRPKKALGISVAVVFFGLFLWAQAKTRGDGGLREDGRDALAALFGLLLLVSAFSGLLRRGLPFQLADRDFLFPGPFRRGEIVFYRLLSLYPFLLVSSVFLGVFLGSRLPNPALAFVGIVLFQVVALHLQTASSLAATRIGDRVFGRLRRSLRIAISVFGVLAVVLFVLSAGGSGSASDVMGDLVRSRPFRVFLFPASAAVDLGCASGIREALLSLAALLACAVVSLGLVLALPLPDFEASLVTSERVARLLARARMGAHAAEASERTRARGIPLPVLGLFRGPGAIAWKNLLVAGRSLRVLAMSAILSLLFLVPLVTGATGGRGGAGLLFGALLPLFLQPHLAFDFRRDFDHFAELKSLPVSPTRLAAAQLAVPVALALALQGLFFGVLAAIREIESRWILPLSFGLPAVTIAVLAVANLVYLIYPTRAVTETGRPNPGGVAGGILVTSLAVAAAMLPGGAVFAALQASTFEGGVAAGIAVQYVVDGLLVVALGRVFLRFDLAREFT